ncbi:MAG: NBR1-Ig-like domain-containing protein [Chloroflexota bacterium]|nr:NBR1-Ig-like domain-containing protein [Chloroflexota bacterium]
MLRNTTRKLALVIMIAIFSTIISACGQSEPKIDVDAQRTGFAQTANVQATMTAEAQPTATQTLAPAATLTPTPEFTPSSDVTTTSTEEETPAATATLDIVDGIDKARWLANVPADKTDFNPGETFTATWTLENIGTTTWTTNYYIQFGSGVQMAPDEKVFLPYPVPPNKNVQISVNFTAPDETGEKQSSWTLFNDEENAFYDFYIIIDVVEPGVTEAPTETTTEIPSETLTVTPTATVTPTP